MSDPVTNHDIEDVLSSIRRLVAQGDSRRTEEMGKSSARFHAPAAEAPQRSVTTEKNGVSSEPAPIERLVLTPAFRVTPQADLPEQPATETGEAAPTAHEMPMEQPVADTAYTNADEPIPAPVQAKPAHESLEATIAELEAAVNSRADEWEPDGSEVAEATDIHAAFANKLDAIRPSRFLRWKEEKDESAESVAASAKGEETPERDNDEVATPTTETTLNHAVMGHISEAVQEEIAEAFPHLMAADESPEDEFDPQRESEGTVASLADAADDSETFAKPDSVTNGTSLADFETDAPESQNHDVRREFETDSTVIRLTPEKVPPAPEPVVEETNVEARTTPFVVVSETPADLDVEEPAALHAEFEEQPEQKFVDAADVEVTSPVNDAPAFRRATSFSEVYDPVAEATADAAESAPDAGDMYGDELAPDPDAPGTSVAAAAPAGQLMDPDMVRDMVSQMIRDELQGEMGERITRNVRKLVRREINRVLSAQDFD